MAYSLTILRLLALVPRLLLMLAQAMTVSFPITEQLLLMAQVLPNQLVGAQVLIFQLLSKVQSPISRPLV
ncbi:hypothetical protein BH09PAT4_BH09PAT4_08860 [soil metagenome]